MVITPREIALVSDGDRKSDLFQSLQALSVHEKHEKGLTSFTRYIT